MPELLIRIKKKTDGAAALSCIRPDGTTTWQRQDGRLGAFFPLHDLTHYAVETVLGFIEKDNPKAKTADPKSFVDDSLLREIEQSGFVKKLYDR